MTGPIFANFRLTGAGAAVRMDFSLMVELTPMIDPKLEDEMTALKGSMQSLRDFHDIFDNTILTEAVVPEDEGKLQDLRATMPEQWDSLFERLGLRSDNSVRTIVAMASSLATVILLTDFERRKLYDLWHRAYMKLHFLHGRLLYRKQTLQGIKRGKGKPQKSVVGPILVIVVLVIALLVFVVLRFVWVAK